MPEYLDAIIGRATQLLLDNVDPAVTKEWTPQSLEVLLGEVMADVSKARPYEVKETVTLTVSGKNEVSISSITNLLSISHGEYPVDKDPRDFRNVTVFGDTATFVMSRRPSGSESAYLYCYKLHTITESTSTLPPTLEDLVVLGLAAKAATSKSRKQINRTNIGGGRVPQAQLTWGELAQQRYERGLKAATKQRIRVMYSEA